MQTPVSRGQWLPRLSLRYLLFVLPILAALLTSCGFAQSPPSGAPSFQKECETFCANWTWAGTYYNGAWTNGAYADLTISSFSPTSIIINRTDTSGSVSYGLTAVYTGTITSSGHAGGSVTWTWPGHSGYPATGSWTAEFATTETGKMNGDCDCNKAQPDSTGGNPSQLSSSNDGSGSSTIDPMGNGAGGGGNIGPSGGTSPASHGAARRYALAGKANYGVTLGTGNLFYSFTDYSTAGQNPLAFTRYYNSRAQIDGLPTLAVYLGTNWRSNYDGYLQLSSSTVTAERPDGQQITFTLTSGDWIPDTDVDVTLTNSGTAWTLTDSNDTVETYTANGAGTEASLSTIALRNGYTQTLAYNGSNQLTSVTDSYSRALSFTYNTLGRIATMITPDSTTIDYTYTQASPAGYGYNLTSLTFPTSPTSTLKYTYGSSSGPNDLIGITDENNDSYTTWGYTTYSRASSTRVGGTIASTTYGYTSTTTTMTNALGAADTYTYTTIANVPKVSGISRAATSTTAAATRAFTYDTNGYLASATDWNGNSTTYVNDAHGDPTTINEAVGSSVARTTTIAYDTTWLHLPDTITTPGLTAGFTYDSQGEVLTKTLTDTTTTSIPYSTNGQTRTWTNTYSNSLLATTKTPNGNLTQFGYDSSGSLTSITDPLSHLTSITSHTGGGLPKVIVDPNSVTTTLAYDPRQRLTSSAISGTGGTFTTTYTVDPTGSVTKVTLPDSSYLSYAYTFAHLLNTITDAASNSISISFDGLYDLTQVETLNPSSTIEKKHTATFDALGRTLTDLGGQSQTTTFTYDKNGNALTVKDGLSHSTTNVFDALNHLSTSTDANSGTTTNSYDAYDRLLSVQDANGNTTSYVRDGFGDIIQQTSPDSGTSVYYFDGDANLTKKLDALTVETDWTYDGLERPLTTSYPSDSTENVAYTYDQTGTGFTFGVGRLTSVTDAAGSITRAYDERGNLLTEQRVNGTNTLTTSYTYDNAGRIASITYPDGSQVSNTYTTAGYLHVVTGKPYGASTATTLATIGHEPFGPINSVTFGNGISESWTYDLDYRPTNITDTLSSANVQKLTYTYDAANNLKTIADAVHAANGQTLGYDIVNRLTSAVSGTGGYGSYGWTIDKVGNWQTQTLGGTTTNYYYTSGTNRLSAINTTTVSTNANGNITSIPPANSGTSATFAYNAANRLSSVTGSPTGASFVYDWQGQRFTKAQPSSTPILYSYAQDHSLIAENNSGMLTDYVYADGRPIADLQPGTTPTANQINYVLADRQGTPQTLYNSASTPVNVWSLTYNPYGYAAAPVSGIVNDLRLPGQNYDLETAFHYNMNRDYMPNLGRYLETDPIGLGGGTNTYAYVMDNPSSKTDRSGLDVNSYYGPLLKEWQRYLVNEPDKFTILGEGSEGVQFDYLDPFGANLSAADLALKIFADKDYTPGDTVRIIACGAGVGPNSYAEQVAKELNNLNAQLSLPNSIVEGPNGWVSPATNQIIPPSEWYGGFGVFMSHPNGQYVPFH
jgi:RHS repeat-associated protein